MAAEAATRVTVESIRESPSKPSWTELERETNECRLGASGLGGGFEGGSASHPRATSSTYWTDICPYNA